MIELNFSKYVLKSGVRYLEIPLEKTGVITVLVLVKAGSRFENNKISGISHFIEHMFFKGGKRYKDTSEVASAIDQVGGMFNASTDKEEVAFFVKLPAQKVDVALDVLADMLLNSHFKEEDIKREEKVIIEEINMYEDSPMYQTDELLESILYKNSPLAREIIGKKETIQGLKRSDFLRYINKSYLPGNITIAVAGDTSFISKDKVFKFFNLHSKRKPVNFKKIVRSQKNPEISLKTKNTEQSHIALGFYFPEAVYNHKDFIIAKVLSAVLGGSMSSRLFLSVREKKGLAYSINCFIQSFMDAGHLEIAAGVDNKKVSEAVSAILKECLKMKKIKVGKDELNKAKEYLKGKLTLNLEDSLNAAFHVGKQELLSGKVLSIRKIFEKIDNINSEDIIKLANKNFKNNKLNLAVIGPFKDEKPFKDKLKI